MCLDIFPHSDYSSVMGGMLLDFSNILFEFKVGKNSL